jgi:exonuclease 3'-5' domain-containing protein 1
MAPVRFIANTKELTSVLAAFDNLLTSPPSLYIDLEGAKLSRNGTVSLLTLYVVPQDTVYIIDIHNLGTTAFSTPATSTTIITPVVATTLTKSAESVSEAKPEEALTLKALLESSTIPKVFFDVRNDSDALFAHFNVRLSYIHDLQLMELATTTRSSRDYLIGLSACITYNAHRLSLTPTQVYAWNATKDGGCQLFAPEHGGSYDVFDERPLKPLIQEYCVQDVVHMPELRKLYEERMKKGSFWHVMAREGAEKRVSERQEEGYRSEGQHKRYGCWSVAQVKEARKRWDGGVRSGLC